MPLIIRHIEIAIKVVAPHESKPLFYVYNLHVKIYNWNGIHINMEWLLKSISEVVNEVGTENHLLLEESKNLILVLKIKEDEKISTLSG